MKGYLLQGQTLLKVYLLLLENQIEQ